MTVWLPSLAQHIPNPFHKAKGPSFLSKSDRWVIEETRCVAFAAVALTVGRDMSRTLMVSMGCDAAEQTNLYVVWETDCRKKRVHQFVLHR